MRFRSPRGRHRGRFAHSAPSARLRLAGSRRAHQDLPHVLSHGGERPIAVADRVAEGHGALDAPKSAGEQDRPEAAKEEHAAGDQGRMQAWLRDIDREDDPDGEQIADLHAGGTVDSGKACKRDGKAGKGHGEPKPFRPGEAKDDTDNGAEQREGKKRRQPFPSRGSGIGEAGQQGSERGEKTAEESRARRAARQGRRRKARRADPPGC